MAELVVTQCSHGRVLELNRPHAANSLSAALVEDLHLALEDAEADPQCRTVLIKGSGKHFCAGFDLSDIEDINDGELLARFVRIELLLARIWAAPFLTVSIGHGRVVGAGADLFTACSFRLAVEGAKFSFPGSRFGLVLGTRRLMERTGRDMAHDLVVNGRVLDIDEAAGCGLVTSRIPSHEVGTAINRWLIAGDRLDQKTLAALRTQIQEPHAQLDSDLAALVRSASIPGLRDRIMAYRERALVRK